MEAQKNAKIKRIIKYLTIIGTLILIRLALLLCLISIDKKVKKYE